MIKWLNKLTLPQTKGMFWEKVREVVRIGLKVKAAKLRIL